MKLRLPAKTEPLFRPKRYKVLKGGRGSAKSHSVAQILLFLGHTRKLRILCARETQKSIKASVHQLLRDKIDELELGAFYQVLDTEIRGANGTQFLFSGLADHTVDSIKSFEGIDIVWLEEGQVLTKKSLSILIPTIRKEGSEIWITFNPELDTDEVWVRFVAEPSDDTIVIDMNYRDNPWFPAVLEQERIKCQQRDPGDYDTIWEGKCRATVVGAIYANEVRDMIASGRAGRLVPYDPMLQVHVIWDLGWNDSMVLGFVQRVASEVRLIDYIEDSFRTLESYVKDIKSRPWNWGQDWIPHDGRAKDFKSGKSTEEMLTAMGRDVRLIPNTGLEQGIKAARLLIPKLWVAKDKGAPLMEHLKRYRRAINPQTNEPGAPVHDAHSHGADMVRYLAVVADQLTNDTYVAPPPVVDVPTVDSVMGY